MLAPLIEEALKALALLWVVQRYGHEFDGVMDGLLHGAVVGFGFGFTENVLYMLSAYERGGVEAWGATAVGRGVVFLTGHALYTCCFGFTLGLSRYARSPRTRRVAPWLGLGAGVVLHATYNLLASLGTDVGLGILAALVWTPNVAWALTVRFAAALEGRWIADELADEVDRGTIRQADAEAASRAWPLFATRREARRVPPEDRAAYAMILSGAAKLGLLKRRLGAGHPTTLALREVLRSLTHLEVERDPARLAAGPT